jgi:hypothetical protein
MTTSAAVAVAVPLKKKYNRSRAAREQPTFTAQVVATKRKKKVAPRGTVAAAKKIAKAIGPEIKGPKTYRYYGILQNPYSWGGSSIANPVYITPTFMSFTRSQWQIPRSYTDVGRIGNEVVPVKWETDISLTIPQAFWRGFKSTANQAASQTLDDVAGTGVFDNTYTSRFFYWPQDLPVVVHVFLARANSFRPTVSDDTITVADVAWQRFAEADSTSGARAITGCPSLLERKWTPTDHWHIKKRWKFTMSPERMNPTADYTLDNADATMPVTGGAAMDIPVYSQVASSKAAYPSTKRFKIDLTKYLPKRITWDDGAENAISGATQNPTDLPGNVLPLILFVAMYPKGSRCPSIFEASTQTGTYPTVPYDSGYNMAAVIEAHSVVTWMDP